jgi:hypothetical protein
MGLIEAVPGVLAQTFEHFRDCGRGRRECVVYWTGPTDSPGLVDGVVHPLHRSAGGGYEVDSTWVTSFFLELRRQRKHARVQVHTHPHHASHSWIDDQFALVPAPGFLSLVIPDFGIGDVSLRNAHLVRTNQRCEWSEIPLSEIAAP